MPVIERNGVLCKEQNQQGRVFISAQGPKEKSYDILLAWDRLIEKYIARWFHLPVHTKEIEFSLSFFRVLPDAHRHTPCPPPPTWDCVHFHWETLQINTTLEVQFTQREWWALLTNPKLICTHSLFINIVLFTFRCSQNWLMIWNEAKPQFPLFVNEIKTAWCLLLVVVCLFTPVKLLSGLIS